MLESGKLAGFLATTDYDKAREFYEGKLGFEFVSLDLYALVMRVGGHTTFASRRFQLHAAATHPLEWEGTDIMAFVSWLRDRGVELEKYPFVQEHKLGVWTAPGGAKVEWLKDPDGNILSVSQR